YGALDDLDRVLREGAPPSTFTTAEEREWLQTTILDDVVAGIRVVADLTSLDAETIDAAITLAEASPPGSMDS
ncbi:MAG TPA: hypothetical protein VFR32_05610, partial [Gaiellaceae bacterium]|nr:hypothetical protein [Gaiellaceae bacterium]